MEKTFVAIKPDATSRKLIGQIIQRFERLNFNLCGLKLVQISKELAKEHYSEHQNKPFFESLVNFITSGPLVAMVWEGNNAIEITRKILGETDPLKAKPGTIRGDFATSLEQNVVHASDSVISAERELALFFPEGFL